MRIALLSYEYPPETGFGGIGSYTWHHARGLAALGHEVHVLAGARTPQPFTTRLEGAVHVHRHWAGDRVMRAADLPGRWGWWWTRQRLQNAWSMAQGLAELRRRHRIDLVEAPECGAEGAALPRGRGDPPLLLRLHSPAQLIMPFYDVRAGDRWACAQVERRGLRRARAVSACSRFVAEATEAAIGLDRPAEVMFNGLDLDWFDACEDDDAVLRRLDLPPDRPVVLFSGRLERRKGVALLGEIAARLLSRHEVSLVLAGDDLFGHLQRDILPALAGRRLRGGLHPVGHRSIAEIRALVRRCSAFLLPSLWENCPYAALEAMAAGRPVVAARQGGMPELIEDGVEGLLATPGDPLAYAEALDTLLGNPARAAALGRAARRAVEQRHAHTHTAAQAVALYTRTLGG